MSNCIIAFLLYCAKGLFCDIVYIFRGLSPLEVISLEKDVVSLYSENGSLICVLRGDVCGVVYTASTNALEFKLDGKDVSIINTPVVVIEYGE